MRTYFITGGTGFVGNALVKELLSRPDTKSITLLTRKQRVHTNPKVQYLYGDITEVEFPNQFFTDVIHAAAEANDLLAPDKPAYYYSVVEGANRVFDWCRNMRPDHLLFVSSGAVIKGESVYCRAKRMSESLAPHWATIARVYSLCGPGLPIDGQYAFGRFIGDAIYRKKISFYESGSIRSYLHVEDCARWLLRILDKGVPYIPYDVGSEIAISVRELAYKIALAAKVPCEEVERKDYHQTAQVYLPKLAKTLQLGCKETISLEKSIEQILANRSSSYVEPKAFT